MKAVGTDAVGMLRWGLRRYRLVFLVCLLLGGALGPLAALQRNVPVEAEALVVAQRLDMDLTALPRYGQAVFNNGDVTRAILARLGSDGSYDDVIPDRVQLVAEQDSIIFRVLGRDTDPKTAADIANTAAETFVDTLNGPGAGVGTFALQSAAMAPAARADTPDALLAIPVGIGAGVLLGLAVVCVLLVARRPVVDPVDAEEATGVSALGSVIVPRTPKGRIARPEDLAGLAPVCRRLLALPTPIVVLVSRPRDERVRQQLSVALANVLQRVRRVRFVGPPNLRELVGEAEAPVRPQGARPASEADTPSSVTLVDSNEPLDLVQPPESTATVLVVWEGIGGAALRAAVTEHLGGSAEARLLMVKRGRKVSGQPVRGHQGDKDSSREEALPSVNTGLTGAPGTARG
jgi:capsular polysaccharide biosynthesis protein